MIFGRHSIGLFFSHTKLKVCTYALLCDRRRLISSGVIVIDSGDSK